MGLFNDNTVDIKNDLDIHDMTHYLLFFLLVLILVLYYLRKKCNKLATLEDKNRALELRITGKV